MFHKRARAKGSDIIREWKATCDEKLHCPYKFFTGNLTVSHPFTTHIFIYYMYYSVQRRF